VVAHGSLASCEKSRVPAREFRRETEYTGQLSMQRRVRPES